MQTNSPTNAFQRATLFPKTTNSIEFISIHSQSRLAEAEEGINRRQDAGILSLPLEQAGEPDSLPLSLIFINLVSHLKANFICGAAQ